jgi:hypothetical protein
MMLVICLCVRLSQASCMHITVASNNGICRNEMHRSLTWHLCYSHVHRILYSLVPGPPALTSRVLRLALHVDC